jgi:hypothetical protein
MGKNKKFGSRWENDEVPGETAALHRLNELGVPLQAIQTALRAGQLAADFCTTSHPRTYPGMAAWGESTASLRQSLGLLGWAPNDEDNIPRIVSPDGSIVIACISGNDKTGLRDGAAGTRNPRRSAGLRVIRRNLQIEMIELLPEGERGDAAPTAGKTWFLLYRRDRDTVRNELSLARGATEDGKLIEWSERLILPVINLLEGGGDGPGRGVRVIDVPPVDVPVERLAS